MKYININELHGEKLRSLRLKNDVKQYVIANALGITQQGISRLEQGYLNFSDDMITTICHFFDIKKSQFVINPKTLEYQQKNEDKEEKQDNAASLAEESSRDFLLKSVLQELKNNRRERKELRNYIIHTKAKQTVQKPRTKAGNKNREKTDVLAKKSKATNTTKTKIRST
jgi:transcriptional regulator with XRE-family HTH domain